MGRTTLVLILSAVCLAGLISGLRPPEPPNPVARGAAIGAAPPPAQQRAPAPITPLAAERSVASASGAIAEPEPAPNQAAPEPVKPAETPPPQPPAAAAASVPASTMSTPSSTPSTPLPSFDLQYFEDRLDESPHVAAADAEHEAQERDALRIDHENGLKAVAGANASRVSDPYLGQYDAATIYGGLSYPILGSRVREKATLEGARAQAHSLKGRAELARREELRDLRRSYVQYWISGRQLELARTFLSAEEAVRRLLDRRAAAGLLRESKRLDLLTAFDAARSDLASFAAARALALMTINRVAGSGLEEFKPLPPALPPDWPDQGAVLQRVAEHPELEALRALLANRHDLLTYAAYHYPESDILLSLGGVNYSPGGQGGYALLGIEFRVPIGVAGAQREGKAAARLSLIQYQHELDNRTQVLQGQAVEAFDLVAAKNAALSFAGRRLAAAEQGLREDFSRANMVPQDSLEALLQSRRDYYRASMDSLTAEMDSLTTRAALLALTGDPAPAPERAPAAACEITADSIKVNLLGGELLAGVGRGAGAAETKEKAESLFAPSIQSIPSSTASSTPSAQSAQPAEGIAVYMWATHDWLNRTGQLEPRDHRLPSACDYEKDPMWRELADFQVRTVLLSLDRAQINELAGDSQAFAHLVRLIGAARERGRRVELLLGEPTWILPAHRQNLLDVIRKLRSLPFDGLHLDLEPNQLNPVEAEARGMLGDLVETLRVAKEASPWEITATLAPRYFDAKAGEDPLGRALEKAGIRRVALMDYHSDPGRISDRAIELLKANPGLRLNVAVSVEPARTVGAQVTLAGEGRRKFCDTAWALDEALRAYPNYGGLEVQDWASLRELKP